MYKEIYTILRMQDEAVFGRLRVDPSADDPTLRGFDNAFAVLGLNERADPDTPTLAKQHQQGLDRYLNAIKNKNERLRPACNEYLSRIGPAFDKLNTAEACEAHIWQLNQIRTRVLHAYFSDELGEVSDRGGARSALLKRAAKIGLNVDRETVVDALLAERFGPTTESVPPKDRRREKKAETKPNPVPKPEPEPDFGRALDRPAVARGRVGLVGYALAALPTLAGVAVTAAALVMSKGAVQLPDMPLSRVQVAELRKAKNLDDVLNTMSQGSGSPPAAGPAPTAVVAPKSARRYVAIAAGGPAVAAAFSNDGTTLLVCRKDGRFLVFDTKGGRELAKGVLKLPSPALRAMPVGDYEAPYFVARTADRITLIDPGHAEETSAEPTPSPLDLLGPRVWLEKSWSEAFRPAWTDAARGWASQVAALGRSSSRRVKVASTPPGGAWAAIGYEGGGVRLYRRADGGAGVREDRTLHPSGFSPEVVEASSDGKLLLTAGTDGEASHVRLWDTGTWEAVGTLDLSPGDHRGVECLSPDGRQVLARGEGGELQLWKVDDLRKAKPDKERH